MEKILLVDDEPNILNAFKRRLSGTHEFLTATSASDALTILQTAGSVSIIVSDMHMPGMQGSEFLREVAKKYPDSIRVMLTGLADQKTAIKAINDGSVFKFLNKPCSMDQFEQVISECLIQRKLVLQEKDLLQHTLGGIISLITDLLSFIDPDGLQYTKSARRIIREILRQLHLPTLEAELAVMLANLGKLSLPLELLLKISKHSQLTNQEEKVLTQIIPTSAKLLKHIPKLDKVAALLEASTSSSLPTDTTQKALVLALTISTKASLVAFEEEPLHAVIARVLPQLSDHEKQFAQKILEKASVLHPEQSSSQVTTYTVSISQLCAGQRLMADIKDKSGQLLLKKGFLISQALIERIKNHHELVGVEEPIIVDVRTPTIS